VYVPGLKKPGAAGRFDFTLLSSTPAPPALGDNRFLVQGSNRQGEPREGELTVALDMPEHGHPSPEQPQITFDFDSQAFSLEPMRLFMVGYWRITFDFATVIIGESFTDSAVFEFCID